MKKSYLVMAAAAALFAACSSNDLAEEKSPQTTQQTQEQGIMFSAYLNRGTTRAGAEGTLSTDGTTGSDAKKASLKTNGFGVFGYYTDGDRYNENSKPDFFYNQQVTYGTSTWDYSPIKYWPNEFGASAISEGQDKLTFFAYAPHVEVDLTTGIATGTDKTGIISLTRNTAHGDPFVKYYASMDPDTRVDLCWGVSQNGLNSSVDDTNSPNDIKAGAPYIDVTKPKTGDKIQFEFLHALAALNVQIDTDVDVASHADGNLDNWTKIWVRSVTFEGFTDKGMLNLNASKTAGPLWFDLTGNNKIGSGKVTIYDGRSDGKEGQTNADAAYETPADLNAKIVQCEPYDNTDATLKTAKTLQLKTKYATVPGVQHTACNLFNSETATEPIYVIPTDDYLKVTIVYDVETYDPNLPEYLSDGVIRGKSIQNTITKEITMSGGHFKLQAGKFYKLTLHLGMTSVKFDASVAEWGAAVPTSNTDLPQNVPGTTAGTPLTINVPSDALSGTFTVSGLTSGSTLTGAVTGDVNTMTPTTGTTATDGKQTVKWTILAANTGLTKKTGTVTLTETGTVSTITTATVNQKAAALGLNAPTTITNTTNNFTLGATNGGITSNWNDTNPTGGEVTVSIKNGATTLTRNDTTPGTGEFSVGSDGKVTLGGSGKFTTGDIVVITVQAYDADPETISVTVTP